VSGYRSAELQRYIKTRGFDNVLLTENREYRKGMFSSIQCGVRFMRSLVEEENDARQPEPPRFFISLADMPRIGEDDYRSLAAIHTDADVVRPVRHGLPAHPVLCRYQVSRTILAEPAESAMKNVLAQHSLLEVPAADDSLFFDVDTPESYRSLLEHEAGE
jgi:molybdenum cofactor cytidylyltransferase